MHILDGDLKSRMHIVAKNIIHSLVNLDYKDAYYSQTETIIYIRKDKHKIKNEYILVTYEQSKYKKYYGDSKYFEWDYVPNNRIKVVFGKPKNYKIYRQRKSDIEFTERSLTIVKDFCDYEF